MDATNLRAMSYLEGVTSKVTSESKVEFAKTRLDAFETVETTDTAEANPKRHPKRNW
jgi:hypothetical protein